MLKACVTENNNEQRTSIRPPG